MIISQVIITRPVAPEYRLRSKMTNPFRLAVLSSIDLCQTFQKFYINKGERHLYALFMKLTDR